jgi:hypothetical protein
MYVCMYMIICLVAEKAEEKKIPGCMFFRFWKKKEKLSEKDVQVVEHFVVILISFFLFGSVFCFFCLALFVAAFGGSYGCLFVKTFGVCSSN